MKMSSSTLIVIILVVIILAVGAMQVIGKATGAAESGHDDCCPPMSTPMDGEPGMHGEGDEVCPGDEAAPAETCPYLSEQDAKKDKK